MIHTTNARENGECDGETWDTSGQGLNNADRQGHAYNAQRCALPGMNTW